MDEVNLKERWSKEQDEFLLNIVINNLQQGRNRKKAFLEYSQKTGRTIAAVSVRFYSFTRVKYESELKAFNLGSYAGKGDDTFLIQEGISVNKLNNEMDWKKTFSFLNDQEILIYDLKKENAKLQAMHETMSQENATLKTNMKFMMKDFNPLEVNSGKISSAMEILEEAQRLGLVD
ncbi:hypothetical protein MHI32_09585 [Paenibacillus sp. FSL H7-0690]|uniref:hypothetical protein n=1 Tax=Paenibacillus sp. FSL H7-0690 TaxID=2921437 RepID=UPI0030EB4B43